MLGVFGVLFLLGGLVAATYGLVPADALGGRDVNGQVANSLTNDAQTDWGGGVAYYDTMVALTPL